MALSDYGIVSIDTANTSRLTKRKVVEPGTPVLSSVGAFEQNVAKKLHWTIEAEGQGDLPADFALAGTGPANGVTDITGGKTIIESSEETQTNDGEPSQWTASGVNAPNAPAPVV